MDKIKEFALLHKKELIIGASLIFAYKLGFNKGCKATEDAVNNFFQKVIDVSNF